MNSVWTVASLAVGVAAFPPVVGEDAGLPVALGVAGVVAVLLALLAGRVGLLVIGAVFFIGQVATVFAREAGPAWWAVGYAAALLILLEVAVGTMERRGGGAGSAGPQLARLLGVGGIAALVALAVFLIAELPMNRGLLVQAAGVGALAALVLGIALLVREWPYGHTHD